MVKNICLLFVILLTIINCFENRPEIEDGHLTIRLVVKLVSEDYGIDELMDSTVVYLNTTEYEIAEIRDTTDEYGVAEFENLSWIGYHSLAIRRNYRFQTEFGVEILPMMIGDKQLIPQNELYVDTLFLKGPAPKGLKINELYTVGPPNRFFYFYDQYFELYNSSDETVYLDGIHFCRMGSSLDNVTAIFQFPGEPLVGREYPVPPHTFVVIAQDAMNHRGQVFENRASVDLSVADWEFRSSADPGDFENEDVPNLDNIEVGDTKDFMVGLTGDGIIIADGSDPDYLDGIDINSVIDCVEFSSSETHTKEMPEELDAGCGGVGIRKYSGESLERRQPGFDTNNSTVDFVIIENPTVGYQHE